MSSDGDAEVEFIYNVQIGIIDNYCAIAACIVIFYEHMITIFDEYEIIWCRKRTGATLIFLLNRYCTLLFAITLLLTLFDWRTDEVTLVPVGTNLYSDVETWFNTISLPILGTVCTGNTNISVETGNELLIATRACTIASDLLVLIITWSSTYKIKRDADKANVKASLVTFLLRDGTFYFIILLALNTMHMAFYLTNTFVNISWFIVPISSILISRFLLNLRQVYLPARNESGRPSFVRSVHNSESHMSDVRFASTFIGNMGAPLDYGSFTVASDIDGTRDLSSSFEMEGSFSDLGYGGFRTGSEQSHKEMLQVSREPMRVGLDF
ncbi:hypothetical protein OBBRIDRAFT_115613 [Obba rivulosa]|uniref:DUF6533 domain-containing protein n=1 Tax=Obba rivulosa TaxID=1052685 RepID=A0A8E2AYY3_9APHY|nr:hypothetical protein OBBRIDRAFT_115613 [Obba rivulosa]